MTTELTLTKKEYLLDLYRDFRIKSKDFIEDNEFFKKPEEIDLYDLLYYFGIYFQHEKYYQSSFDALLTMFEIDLPDDKYVEAFKILADPSAQNLEEVWRYCASNLASQLCKIDASLRKLRQARYHYMVFSDESTLH
jgi:hypothetical protein